MAAPVTAGVGQGVILHGVDFSGADSGGAAKIRAVTRDLGAPREAVVSLGRMDRRGLVRAVLASRDDGRAHLWRVDAPMSVPAEIAREFGAAGDWMSMARWMQGLGSPRLWRTAVRGLTRREPRRACDDALATPMSPLNLRVFKQTWTFVCEVLLPLAEAGVRIEPSVAGAPGNLVAACEGCPASVLHALGWPRRGYKGGGDPPARVRAEIVHQLRAGGMTIPDALAAEAVGDEQGDLLDALVLVTPPFHAAVPEAGRLEGWVF
ncbi:MAG: hypothetical protein ACKPBA_06850 [Planctomycetota bacterium]